MNRKNQIKQDPASECGISLVELLTWLAVAAIVGGVAVSKFTNILGGTRIEQATSELNELIIAGQSWRRLNGDYTGITVEALVDGGYNLQSYTDGTGENAYGEDIAIAVSAGGADDGLITYTTDGEAACEQLKTRVDLVPGVLAAPVSACSTAGVLTLTIN